MKVLSLSKKSKWPILIILAPLKINNLQATESRKLPGFKVFRSVSLKSANFPSQKSSTIFYRFFPASSIFPPSIHLFKIALTFFHTYGKC
jgi:hypothetical protein